MDGHMSKWTVHESQTERFKRLKVNMDKTGRPKRLSLDHLRKWTVLKWMRWWSDSLSVISKRFLVGLSSYGQMTLWPMTVHFDSKTVHYRPPPSTSAHIGANDSPVWLKTIHYYPLGLPTVAKYCTKKMDDSWISEKGRRNRMDFTFYAFWAIYFWSIMVDTTGYNRKWCWHSLSWRIKYSC